MKLFCQAIFITCLTLLPSLLQAQTYTTLYNSPPVESDTHWLVKNTDTDVELELPGQPDNVYQEVTAQSNCVIVDQDSSVWSISVTLHAPQSGACILTLRGSFNTLSERILERRASDARRLTSIWQSQI